jgi:hypothetical protein
MPQPSEVAQEFEDVEETTVDEPEEEPEEVETPENKEEPEDKPEDEEEPEDGKDKPEDEEDGYYADEGPNKPVDKPTTAPDKPELPPVPGNFTEEQKYIVDNLPLINVRVVMNDDSVKTLQVRSANDLPADAKGFASFREGELFKEAITVQELKARELQSFYRQHQSTLQAQEFERKEKISIREDIAALQREGVFPLYKAKPGTRGYNEDQAVQFEKEVTDFMNKRNDEYLQHSNKGGVYRHIGFAEAFEIMAAQAEKEVVPNSDARKRAARQLVTGQGTTTKGKSKVPAAGRQMKDVIAKFDDFEV